MGGKKIEVVFFFAKVRSCLASGFYKFSTGSAVSQVLNSDSKHFPCSFSYLLAKIQVNCDA